MAGDPSPKGIFELHETIPGGAGQDLLGLWTAVALEPARGGRGDRAPADAQAGEVAFGAPGAPPPETVAKGTGGASVWQANFPADQRAIAIGLGEAQQKLQIAEAALAATPARLDAFVLHGVGGLAYGLPAPGTGLAGPEDDLSLLLAELQGAPPIVSYGVGEQLAGRWQQAVEMFEAFTARLQQMVAGLAWVETSVGGQLVGQTVVTWTGDVRTVLPTRIEPDQVKLHQHTLNLALVSRWMALRMSALAITNAVKLSVLSATPGGIVAAIPAVLRFINQIRVEFERMQKIKEEA